MNPKVSIIMPVYNSEKYLKDALESLIYQSYHNLEILCIDDGSKDKSLSILNDFQKTDSRLTVIRQNNLFAGIARNNGLSKATGKYTIFLDSDDIFEKNMISYLVKKAEKKNTDIIFFGFYQFNNSIKHRSMMGIPYVCSRITSSKEHQNNLFQIGGAMPWNKFYKTEFIRNTKLQFQALQSNNDVFFSKSSMLYAERLLFLNKRFVNYRVNNAHSLQGSYDPNLGNFAKCLYALRDELIHLKLYDYYRDTFEKYVLATFLTIFNKAFDLESFMTICEIEKQAFSEMNITKNSIALIENPAHNFFEHIIDGDFNDGLLALYHYMQENYISKQSMESKIGRKILGTLRIKVYDTF